MTALPHKRASLPSRTAGAPCLRDGAARVVILRATGDGWSLITPDGDEMFHAVGIAGRHEALEFAHDHDVLVVLG
jgi:hypothetical protein